MRKNLADLRGQLVVWMGWETNSRHKNTWTCISKATVTPWDYKTPIQKSFTKNLTKVDHFWLISNYAEEYHHENNQYEKLGGIGVVKSYMRKDGLIKKKNAHYDDISASIILQSWINENIMD